MKKVIIPVALILLTLTAFLKVNHRPLQLDFPFLVSLGIGSEVEFKRILLTRSDLRNLQNKKENQSATAGSSAGGGDHGLFVTENGGPSNEKINSALRDQLLGNIIKTRLEMMHYSQKEVNDELSEKAFKLYIERLDPGKQFLLQEDVDKLSKYKQSIDDELLSGEFDLIIESEKIVKKRIDEALIIVETVAKSPIDFNKSEKLESDAKKRNFPKNKAELAELWRKIFKYNVLSSYLTYQEEAKEQDKEKEKEKEKDQTATKKNGKDKEKDKEKDKDKVAAVVPPVATPVKKLTPEEMEKKAVEETLKNYKKAFTRRKQEDHDDQLELFINSVAMVFDPHTNYMPPQKKEDFDIEMKGTLEGIGALLKEDGPHIKVVKIIPGSASAKQKKLGPEDTILKVAQGNEGEAVDIVNMRINDAVKLIRGPKGTTVRLTIKKPTGEVMTIALVRDVVQIEESYAKGALLEYEGTKQRYGYIYLPKFYRDFEAQSEGKESARNCTDDVKAILAKFKKESVSGVILDLRNNGGGALEDARLLSGLFITKGPIVQVSQSKSGKDVLYDSDESVEYSGPLIVLINRFSASASEIVAAAMQDYGRAIVIGGDHSHGKGTVQLFLNLDQGIDKIAKSFLPLGALKITIQKFYRVNGGSTQYKGVIPDIYLPDPLEGLETSEKNLDYSLKWDEVKPLKYDKWTFLPQTVVQKVVANSKMRVQKSEKFSKLQHTAEILKKRREATVVSLNINDMKAEQEKIKAENKQYKVDQVDDKILVFKDLGSRFQKVDFPLVTKGEDKKKSSVSSSTSLVPDAEDSGDSEQEWPNSLRKNPYIEEAMFVLKDMIDIGKDELKYHK